MTTKQAINFGSSPKLSKLSLSLFHYWQFHFSRKITAQYWIGLSHGFHDLKTLRPEV